MLLSELDAAHFFVGMRIKEIVNHICSCEICEESRTYEVFQINLRKDLVTIDVVVWIDNLERDDTREIKHSFMEDYEVLQENYRESPDPNPIFTHKKPLDDYIGQTTNGSPKRAVADPDPDRYIKVPDITHVNVGDHGLQIWNGGQREVEVVKLNLKSVRVKYENILNKGKKVQYFEVTMKLRYFLLDLKWNKSQS